MQRKYVVAMAGVAVLLLAVIAVYASRPNLPALGAEFLGVVVIEQIEDASTFRAREIVGRTAAHKAILGRRMVIKVSDIRGMADIVVGVEYRLHGNFSDTNPLTVTLPTVEGFRPLGDYGEPAPVVGLLEVVAGERLAIERAQADALTDNGAPLRLHEKILALNWSHATVEYPRIYVYNWAEGESLLLDIHTGETLASGASFTNALRDRWTEVTANKFGAFTDHRFGLTLWRAHANVLAGVQTFLNGVPSGDWTELVGRRWQGFMLSTAPDALPVTVIGAVTDAGEVMFFRPLRGRGIGLAWSYQGNRLAVIAQDSNGAATLYGFRYDTPDPVFTLAPQDVQQALGIAQEPAIEAHSAHWTVDERILHFRAVLDKPEGSLFSVYSDGTGLVAMPNQEIDEADRKQLHAAFAAYRSAITQRSLRLATELPEAIVHEVIGEKLLLRQNALELLQEPHLFDLGGMLLALDRGADSGPLLLPQTLRVWHDTNHYQGHFLVILDAQGRRLAEVDLVEIAHWNVLFRPVELDLATVLPRSGSGYIVGLTTSAKDGVMPLAQGVRVPVRFR